MVPCDAVASAEYKDAIGNAVADVRWWYKQQLDATFVLHGEVEVILSARDGAWFGQNNLQKQGDNAYYFNVLAEARTHVGARQNNGSWVWVIYCDAPGNKGRGTAEVCVLAGDDLLGLTGHHPVNKRISRWRGGLGHEIGHCVGLAEGPAAATTPGYDSLMSHGFLKYPKTYLTEGEKAILRKSPFFFGKGMNAQTGWGGAGIGGGAGLGGGLGKARLGAKAKGW